MNAFRLAGDMMHLLAMVILLTNIVKSKSCAGISGKTQVMFALVFLTRYTDLLYYFISPYNSVMKIIYISLTLATCFLIFVKFKKTYERDFDSMRFEYLIVFSATLACLINHDFSALEIVWTFSIYLEAFAILPQLFMIHKTGEVKTITTYYLFAMFSYRALYIANWGYRYHFENHLDWIAIVSGVVQTVFYLAFVFTSFMILNKPIENTDERVSILNV